MSEQLINLNYKSVLATNTQDTLKVELKDPIGLAELNVVDTSQQHLIKDTTFELPKITSLLVAPIKVGDTTTKSNKADSLKVNISGGGISSLSTPGKFKRLLDKRNLADQIKLSAGLYKNSNINISDIVLAYILFERSLTNVLVPKDNNFNKLLKVSVSNAYLVESQTKLVDIGNKDSLQTNIVFSKLFTKTANTDTLHLLDYYSGILYKQNFSLFAAYDNVYKYSEYYRDFFNVVLATDDVLGEANIDDDQYFTAIKTLISPIDSYIVVNKYAHKNLSHVVHNTDSSNLESHIIKHSSVSLPDTLPNYTAYFIKLSTSSFSDISIRSVNKAINTYNSALDILNRSINKKSNSILSINDIINFTKFTNINLVDTAVFLVSGFANNQNYFAEAYVESGYVGTNTYFS